MKTKMNAAEIIELLEAKRAIYQGQADRAAEQTAVYAGDASFLRSLKAAAEEKVLEYDGILRDIETGLKVTS